MEEESIQSQSKVKINIDYRVDIQIDNSKKIDTKTLLQMIEKAKDMAVSIVNSIPHIPEELKITKDTRLHSIYVFDDVLENDILIQFSFTNKDYNRSFVISFFGKSGKVRDVTVRIYSPYGIRELQVWNRDPEREYE